MVLRHLFVRHDRWHKWKMKKPSPEQIRKHWLQVYSWQSFRLARDAADLLLSQKEYPDPNNVVQKCAVTALYTAYGRPFGRNYGAGQLPNARVIPEKFRELHERLIDYRDQTIAHKDNNPGNEVAATVNRVHIVISEGNRFFAPRVHFPAQDELKQIIDLCDVLIRKSEYHMGRFGKTFVSPLRLRDGRYRVNVDEDNWLIPAEE